MKEDSSVRAVFRVCICIQVNTILVCRQTTVQTRCCSPQSVSAQAGRPVHCAHMDSWSRWYSLLLHLTPGHQGICSLMYSLYWSVSNQVEGEKRMWAKQGMYLYVSVIVCKCLTSVGAILYLHKPCPECCSSSDTQSQLSHVEQWSSQSKPWGQCMMLKLGNKWQIHDKEIYDHVKPSDVICIIPSTMPCNWAWTIFFHLGFGREFIMLGHSTGFCNTHGLLVGHFKGFNNESLFTNWIYHLSTIVSKPLMVIRITGFWVQVHVLKPTL